MKYYVVRHRVVNGADAFTEVRYVNAESEKQAISQTRYALTKTDKMPNGEPTDYIDEQGGHIYWTAEAVNSVIDEIEDDVKIPEKEEKANDIHVIATGASADKFRALKAKYGIKKNTDTLTKILEELEKPSASTFVLSDEIESKVKGFAQLFNTTRDELIARAVISYLNKLGNMTINDLIKYKDAREAKHG